MKHYSIVLLTLFLLISSLVFSQEKKIQVTFLGNSGFHLTDGEMNVYLDFPYKSGAHKYMEYDAKEIEKIPENSIFLFTHNHSDHYSEKLIKNIKGKFFGPFKFPKSKGISLEELNTLDKDFKVEVFDTSHNFSFGNHYSMLIIWHGKKIFVSGDTGEFEPWSKIEGIDLALTNFWIYRNAHEAGSKVEAGIIGICHLYPDAKIESEFPENVKFFLTQNEVIEF